MKTKELAKEILKLAMEMENENLVLMNSGIPIKEKKIAIADWSRAGRTIAQMKEIIKRCGGEQNISTSEQEKS